VKCVFKSVHNHRRYLHFCDRHVCSIKYASTQRLQLRPWPILCTGLCPVQLFLVADASMNLFVCDKRTIQTLAIIIIVVIVSSSSSSSMCISCVYAVAVRTSQYRLLHCVVCYLVVHHRHSIELVDVLFVAKSNWLCSRPHLKSRQRFNLLSASRRPATTNNGPRKLEILHDDRGTRDFLVCDNTMTQIDVGVSAAESGGRVAPCLPPHQLSFLLHTRYETRCA